MTFRRVAVVMLLLMFVAALAWIGLHIPYAGFKDPVVVEVPRGTATRGIARLLSSKRVILFDWQFLIARALRRQSVLQAGEYKFEKPASVTEIIDRMIRGDVVRYEVRVPEGSNIFDIAAIVEKLGFVTAQDFLKVARDPALVRDMAPRALSLEGYLFPSTYYITRDTTAHEVCRRMTDQFRQVWNSLKTPEADVHKIITMASLVEKETAVREERPLVSAVYQNRLKAGLMLQCDPTTIYASLLAGAYRGEIHQSDLDRLSPYNTYRVAGLPPGPIACPGRDSIAATLSPAAADFVYFVAKPDGSGAHVFSRNLEDHNRAVALYRRGTRLSQNRQDRTR